MRRRCDRQLLAREAPRLGPLERPRHGLPRRLGVALSEEPDPARHGAEARRAARETRLPRAAPVRVLLERRGTALDARPLARLAAPLFRVEGEPPRVEVWHAGAALGAGARRGQHLLSWRDDGAWRPLVQPHRAP